MNNIYNYPAIFRYRKDGTVLATFPDFNGEKVISANMLEAQNAARDLLSMILINLDQASKAAPTPTDIENVKSAKEEYVLQITCDVLEYQKRQNSKAVKRSVSLPKWLNDEANKRGLRCSALLQEALLCEIGKK